MTSEPNPEPKADASSPPRGVRIISGIQSSGTIHLGNYLGALRQHIALQEHNDARYFIADYHSMTGPIDAKERRFFAHEIVLDYLALGLDPERSILYRQSDVPEVCELCWILATVTPMGLLERGHAYKDARAKGESVEAGLFFYPVLMAADILMHAAHCVPVGQDQKQHIEITRDLAQKFNQRYGDVLQVPEGYILPSVGTIPGIDGRKMSKSYGNTIEMFAPKKQLRKQVMSIVTDSTPVEEPKDPELPLFSLWRLFADQDEWAAMRERCVAGGVGYGEVKKDLFERLLRYFAAARERRESLATKPDDVEDLLRQGAARARTEVAPVLAAVREAAGLGPPSRLPGS